MQRRRDNHTYEKKYDHIQTKKGIVLQPCGSGLSATHKYSDRTGFLFRAETITRHSTHPAHHLFDLLPSGRCYRSIKTRTNRLWNSFFPQAITALNTKNKKQALTRTHTHTHTQGQCAIPVKTILYLFYTLTFLYLQPATLPIFICFFNTYICTTCLVLVTLFYVVCNIRMLLEFCCTLDNDNKRILILYRYTLF